MVGSVLGALPLQCAEAGPMATAEVGEIARNRDFSHKPLRGLPGPDLEHGQETLTRGRREAEAPSFLMGDLDEEAETQALA